MYAIKCLDRGTIAALLSGSLPAEAAAEVEVHLCKCKTCCAQVEAALGADDWSANAERFLRDEIEPTNFHEPSAGSSASRKPPTEESSLGDRIRSEMIGLLAPTDYPDMLGRIGHYEIAGVLGHGGMGGVFKGFDRSLHRFVAIKILLPHLAVSAASRARFAREAKAIAAVVDDHVMAIHGVDQWQSVPYFVMPLLRGESLQTRLDDHGPLGIREVLRISTQAAKGLAAAHAQGIVHRDVKPANIFLDGETERAQLMDFGIALAIDDPSLTKTGILSGTPQFMSPEQSRGEHVTASSDLFSLGSVMYCMITGEAPFRAETVYAVLRQITDKPIRRMRELNPEVPSWLDDIVRKLMEKNPADRFDSAREVADLLQGCLAHVQQPTSVDLPEELISLRPADQRLIDRSIVSKPRVAGILTVLLTVIGLSLVATDENPGRLSRVQMMPHAIVIDGSDRLTVSQLWNQWKEMPVNGRHELRAQQKLREVFEAETTTSSQNEYLSRRRQWAIEILPLVTSGVVKSKADFLLGFLHPLDPAMRSRLELPHADDASREVQRRDPKKLDDSDLRSIGWDIQTTLAMTLGRSGRHTDAGLVIDNVIQQIQLVIELDGGHREIQFQGYEQPIRSVLSWCYFYRATIENMTVTTLEVNLEDSYDDETT